MKIGDIIAFNFEHEAPCWGWTVRSDLHRYKPNVMGAITYINRPHKYFVVSCVEHSQRFGFKFNDIGKTCYFVKKEDRP